MTYIRVNANLVNSLAKTARENIVRFISESKMSAFDNSIRYVMPQNDVLHKLFRLSEDVMKYSDEEIDKKIEVAVEDWLILKNWSDYKKVEQRPPETK